MQKAVKNHKSGKFGRNIIFLIIFLGLIAVVAGNCLAEPLDKKKYITIDEIKPGMKGYCLTCYEGTKIEKFEIKVLDVVKNFQPGRSAIMIMGTDKRFIHTGPVAGCSGSPVYINKRLAGAMAFGWTFSKDPLYGVTPIAEMLEVKSGKSQNANQVSGQRGFSYNFDFSKPLSFSAITNQMKTSLTNMAKANDNRLLCPLSVGGLGQMAFSELDEALGGLGFMAVAGAEIGSGSGSASEKMLFPEDLKIKLEPGSSVAVPLVDGDITMAAVGTVTEVVGNKIYGFGHSFLGYGDVDFPMATARVHTVVSSVARSFKFASPVKTVGALKADESVAIYGVVGEKAKMIPMKISIDRYNDDPRVYRCRLTVNQIYAPVLLRSCIYGAAFKSGVLPPNCTVKYKAKIITKSKDVIEFDNVGNQFGLLDFALDMGDIVAVLLNNPFYDFQIDYIFIKVEMADQQTTANLTAIELDKTKLQPGAILQATLSLDTFGQGRKKYTCQIKIPENLTPGKYQLNVFDAYEYEDFVMKNAPYKFMTEDKQTLVTAIGNLVDIKKNALYLVLPLTSKGLAIGSSVLPDLPTNKAFLFADGKRAMGIVPCAKWQETIVVTDSIVIGTQKIFIEIKK